MRRSFASRAASPETLLVLSGFFIVIEGVATLYAAMRHGGSIAPVSLVLPWMLAGALGPLAIAIIAFRPSAATPLPRIDPAVRRIATIVGALFVFVAIGCAAWFLVTGERLYAVVFAIAQAVLYRRLLASAGTALRPTTLTAIAILAWVMTLGLLWTTLGNALLGALPDTNLMPISFCVTLVAVTVAFVPRFDREAMPYLGKRLWAFGIATAFFAWQSFRADQLYSDFIPYHRAYYAIPANFVKQGHWLMWDIPSQYGFFSELAIALTPSYSAWQGLYVLTAVILTIQALIACAIFWSGTRSRAMMIVGAALAAAANFSADGFRPPFGSRLYPQGGLRFIIIIGLLYAAFRMYRAQSSEARSRFRLAGTLIWGFGCFWALESTIWGTIVWFTVVVGEGIVDIVNARRETRRATIFAIARTRLLPLIVVPSMTLIGVDLFYAMRLHHLPDWVGYLEFSSIYASDSQYFLQPKTFDSGWAIVVFLAAIGTVIIAAARAKRFAALPLLSAAWIAVWASSSYYFGEAWTGHVALLAPVIVTAIAICITVGACEGLGTAVRASAALAFMPFCVLLLAFSVPGTRPLFATRGPLVGTSSFNSLANAPTIPSELEQLERRAGITPNDPVLFPSSAYWNKLTDGLILPFVRDRRTHAIVEQKGWLPFNQTGMINTVLTLPLDRRYTYTERYLERTHTGGWMLTFHQRPSCATLSPHLVTVRVVASENFYAALCRYTATPDASVVHI